MGRTHSTKRTLSKHTRLYLNILFHTITYHAIPYYGILNQSTDGANTLYQTFAINNTIHHTLVNTNSYQMITILCSWAMGAYTLPYFNIPFHTMPYQTDPHSTKPYHTLTHFNTTFVPFITFTKLPHCTTNHTISCHTIQ